MFLRSYLEVLVVPDVSIILVRMKYIGWWVISMLVLCSVVSGYEWPVDRYTLAPLCTYGQFSVSCEPKIQSIRDELFPLLDEFLTKKFGALSPQQRDKKYTTVAWRIDTILWALQPQTFLCEEEGAACEILSEKKLTLYAIYLFIQHYLEAHTVQLLESTDGYELYRFDEIYIVKPLGALDWQFDHLGKHAEAYREQQGPHCAVINGWYFGREVTEQGTIYRPAGDLTYVDSFHPEGQRISSINANFGADRNLQVAISYDDQAQTMLLGSQEGRFSWYAGPMIIEEGMLREEVVTTYSHYEQVTQRTFLVVEPSGEWYLGFVPGGMALAELGRTLQHVSLFSSRFNTVNLDGGSSTAFASKEYSYHTKSVLPRWFSVCPGDIKKTQQQLFMDEIEQAVATSLEEIREDTKSDLFLWWRTITDLELVTPSSWLPLLTQFEIEATLNLYDVIPYQWECGAASADQRTVVGCKKEFTVKKEGGEWRVDT